MTKTTTSTLSVHFPKKEKAIVIRYTNTSKSITKRGEVILFFALGTIQIFPNEF